MDLNITLADLVVALLGAVVVGQAAMTAALIAPTRQDARVHRWLLLLLSAVGLVSAGDVVEHAGLGRELWWVAPLSTASLLCIGPALWLYVGGITTPASAQPPDRRGWGRAAAHFVPALLLAAYLFAAGDAGQVTNSPPSRQREPAELLALAPIALQLFAYLCAVVWRILVARKSLKLEYSSLDGRTLSWMLATSALFVGVLVAWVLSWAIGVTASDLLTNALSALALLVTGRHGARQRNVYAGPARDAVIGHVATPPVEPSPKYLRSTLTTDTAERLRAELDRVMQSEQPHLENDLTLAELARRVGTTSHQLSQLLSQHVDETFFDFVNRHRVDAVKATLARPRSAGRPLLEIALECGFGSKSTFNDTFRKATGMSPGEYRRRLPDERVASA